MFATEQHDIWQPLRIEQVADVMTLDKEIRDSRCSLTSPLSTSRVHDVRPSPSGRDDKNDSDETRPAVSDLILELQEQLHRSNQLMIKILQGKGQRSDREMINLQRETMEMMSIQFAEMEMRMKGMEQQLHEIKATQNRMEQRHEEKHPSQRKVEKGQKQLNEQKHNQQQQPQEQEQQQQQTREQQQQQQQSIQGNENLPPQQEDKHRMMIQELQQFLNTNRRRQANQEEEKELQPQERHQPQVNNDISQSAPSNVTSQMNLMVRFVASDDLETIQEELELSEEDLIKL